MLKAEKKCCFTNLIILKQIVMGCHILFLQEMHLLPAMYEVPGTEISKVIIDEDVVIKRQPPKFVTEIPEESSTDIGVRDINLKMAKSNPAVTALTDSPQT